MTGRDILVIRSSLPCHGGFYLNRKQIIFIYMTFSIASASMLFHNYRFHLKKAFIDHEAVIINYEDLMLRSVRTASVAGTAVEIITSQNSFGACCQRQFRGSSVLFLPHVLPITGVPYSLCNLCVKTMYIICDP